MRNIQLFAKWKLFVNFRPFSSCSKWRIWHFLTILLFDNFAWQSVIRDPNYSTNKQIRPRTLGGCRITADCQIAGIVENLARRTVVLWQIRPSLSNEIFTRNGISNTTNFTNKINITAVNTQIKCIYKYSSYRINWFHQLDRTRECSPATAQVDLC